MRLRTVDFCTRAARPVLAWCSLATLFLACSCDRFPDSYAVPAQRPAIEDPERWERVIRMTDVDAPDHFERDIFNPLAANWRWTGRSPRVRLGVPAPGRFRYRIEFVIPDETLRTTGPVKLTFLVNEHSLEMRSYTAAGSYEFEKDIPPEWISRGGDVRLGAEIDKVLPLNGRAYGFLLIAIGLKRD